MSWFEEVLLTVLVGLSPIWAALVIGAICWAARRFGGATERTSNARSYEERTDCHGLRPRNDRNGKEDA